MTTSPIYEERPSPEQPRYTGRKILAAGGGAAILSGAINALVFLIGDVFGAFPDTVTVPTTEAPITVGSIVIASFAGAVLATIAFFAIAKLTHRPARNFLVLAAVVLIASFAIPFTIPGAPIAMIVLLEVMHIVVAASSLYLLLNFARRTPRMDRRGKKESDRAKRESEPPGEGVPG